MNLLDGQCGIIEQQLISISELQFCLLKIWSGSPKDLPKDREHSISCRKYHPLKMLSWFFFFKIISDFFLLFYNFYIILNYFLLSTGVLNNLASRSAILSYLYFLFCFFLFKIQANKQGALLSYCILMPSSEFQLLLNHTKLYHFREPSCCPSFS